MIVPPKISQKSVDKIEHLFMIGYRTISLNRKRYVLLNPWQMF